jgi:hypothetical protein
MLLNLVRLRYADAPIFLDVASVIAQYSLEGQVNASIQVPDIGGRNALGLGGAGRWADRPTITYVPLSGQRFTRSLLTPIPPASIVNLVQGGWTVDMVFRISVRAVNGVRGETRMRLLAQEEDPGFQPLLDALSRLQAADAIGLRVERREGEELALLTLPADGNSATRQDRALVVSTLGLDPTVGEFAVTYGARNRSQSEIALLTRSMIEILGDLAFDVQVPEEHVHDGRVGSPVGGRGITRGAFKVATSRERPAQAFAAVPYGSHWFWIDDRDFASKRSLSFLMLLLSLAETGGGNAAPGLTITAGQ